MIRRRLIFATKYAVYGVIMIVLFALQNVPSLLSISGVKPQLLFAFALAAAVFESEIAGGIIGIFCGLLCDVGSHMLFGTNALIFLVVCVGIGLLVRGLIRQTLINTLILTLLASLLRAVLEYYFVYRMWGYEEVGVMLTGHLLPVAYYTTAIAAIPYFLVRAIHRRYAALRDW